MSFLKTGFTKKLKALNHLTWLFMLITSVFAVSTNYSCQAIAQSQIAAQSKKITRDWATYPAIVEVDAATDIYVIGDIHGDYEGLLELLLASDIISEKPKHPNRVQWNAGNSMLVIPGDLISKGPQSVDVILILRKLQKTASVHGGRVIITLGNHEAEFLTDQKDEKVKVFRKELKALGISAKEVAHGKDTLGIGAFLRNLPFAVRVNNWYFVHAGHPKKYSLKALKSKIEQGVDEEGFGASILLNEDKGILEARMKPRPWWEKKKDSPKESESRLQNLIKELEVSHIVIGHQPGNYKFSDGDNRKKGKMYQKFNGMIFLVDTGMESKKSDGAVLHIHQVEGRETATVIYPDKKKRKELWSEN